MHNAIAVIYTKDVKRSYLVRSKETKSDESAIAPMPGGEGGKGLDKITAVILLLFSVEKGCLHFECILKGILHQTYRLYTSVLSSYADVSTAIK